jgi:hypothetical protein
MNGIGHACRKKPQYPYAITLGALPEREKHLVYKLANK